MEMDRRQFLKGATALGLIPLTGKKFLTARATHRLKVGDYVCRKDGGFLLHCCPAVKYMRVKTVLYGDGGAVTLEEIGKPRHCVQILTRGEFLRKANVMYVTGKNSQGKTYGRKFDWIIEDDYRG